MKKESVKIIISGGGTGGHIFPAIAIANALKETLGAKVDILFIGAKGKMEMEKVPEAGYPIVGLNIAGIQRSMSFKNLCRNITFPFKLMQSMQQAKKAIDSFEPEVVIGVGGFASGPTLRCATNRGIPTLIQEQNSYPGVTNKILSKKVDKICVAYAGMENFFPTSKIITTGNPIRKQVIDIEGKKEEALRFFGLENSKKTLFVVGGSLGAWSINQAIRDGLKKLDDAGLQIIWQTGKPYYEHAVETVREWPHVKAVQFIKEMDLAYAAADIIVSRAGAIAISELCNVGKPVIFVPYPHASENHQFKNAMALVNNKAAWLVSDSESANELVNTITALLGNNNEMERLSTNIKRLAIKDADNRIAEEIIKLIDKNLTHKKAE